MKLSIITPVYRTEATLKRCVESVLKQSFTDYELILIDDGSDDACPQLCDEYAEKDSRVKVIHTENKGLGEARNKGIEIATGEYVTFIDSDDAIQEGTLQVLMDELSQHPDVDILEYPIKERIGNPKKEKVLSFEPKEYENPLDYWLGERVFDHTYVCNKVFKNNLLHQGTRFAGEKTFEDVLFTPLIINLPPWRENKNTLKIRVTNVGLYLYYWNSNGITAKAERFDLLCLYMGNMLSLRNTLERLKQREKETFDKYRDTLEDYMARILNIYLDLYDLTRDTCVGGSLLHDVRWLARQGELTHYKLKLFNKLGFKLCVINRLLHKIYRQHPW